MRTVVELLSEFTTATRFEDLPETVVQESKRLLVDSIGCALGGLGHPKGAIGVKYAAMLGPGAPGQQATILATGERVSAVGAAFANGELINALDFDAVLPPGHVSPYVIPPALAAAETANASGQSLLCAVAIAHEMSNRIGKAMDSLRDTKDGKSFHRRFSAFPARCSAPPRPSAKSRGTRRRWSRMRSALRAASLPSIRNGPGRCTCRPPR